MQVKNFSKFVSVFWLIKRDNSIRRCVQSSFFWIVFVIVDVNFILKREKIQYIINY